jgi:hypothetical protein
VLLVYVVVLVPRSHFHIIYLCFYSIRYAFITGNTINVLPSLFELSNGVCGCSHYSYLLVHTILQTTPTLLISERIAVAVALCGPSIVTSSIILAAGFLAGNLLLLPSCHIGVGLTHWDRSNALFRCMVPIAWYSIFLFLL